MKLIALLIAPLVYGQADTTRADVKFVNDTQFRVSVFLKQSRKTFGPIDSGDFVKVPAGFALGENDYLVIRELGDARTLRQFALVSPARERIYPAAAGRPPKPVTIELTNDIFKTVRDEDRDTPLRVENNTEYPISVFARGQGAGLAIVPPGKTCNISPALKGGKTDLVLIAQEAIRPDGELQGPIVDIAFTSVEAAPNQRSATVLVVSDKTFGPWGLPQPPNAAAQAARQAKDVSRGAYEVIIRRLTNRLQTSSAVDDSERAALGITVPDRIPTPVGAPTSKPVLSADTSQRLRITVGFADEGTPTSRAKPPGVMGCEIWVKLGGPPPTDLTECQFLTLDTRTPYTANFDGSEANQTAHFIGRWVSTRGDKGPLSETVSATVPG